MPQTDTKRRAAVPAYLGHDFRGAAPGHRFNLYLQVWDDDWQKIRGVPQREEVALGDDDRQRATALIERQQALAAQQASLDSDAVLSLPAESTAPFTTGLGMEHPLENGFAFLTPYGLPYLPGSSIKGVLLQAARELGSDGAFEDPKRDWNREAIERLFGSAGPEDDGLLERRRGALIFHDVFPLPQAGANLQWDVMTPHQGAYHADSTGSTPPHDNDSPKPVHFLTVPVGSRFRFIIGCNQALLSNTDLLAPNTDDEPRWQGIVRGLLEHAFTWLGFGAKTSVGYGTLQWNQRVLEREDSERAKQREEKRKQAERTALPPGERRVAELLEDKTNPTYPDHRHLLEKLEADTVAKAEQVDVARIALQRLDEQRRNVAGPKKKRERKLQELADQESRLQAFKGDQ